MGLRDFARTLRPGNDHALAAEIRQKEERRKEEQRKLIKAMAERDKKRTAEERRASAERARRGKAELARKGSGARLF